MNEGKVRTWFEDLDNIWISDCPNPKCHTNLEDYYKKEFVLDEDGSGYDYEPVSYKPKFCPECGWKLIWND